MIDENLTFQRFGYKSGELSPNSNKKIVAICDECGKVRLNCKGLYRDLCRKCSGRIYGPKISKSKKGKPTGKRSNDSRKNISVGTRKRLDALLTPEFLITEYCVKKKTAKSIGEAIGCNYTTVIERLKRLGVAIRGIGESNSGKPKPRKLNLLKKCVSSLNDRIYGLLEYKNWRTTRLILDGYKCQECFKPNGQLRVHHLKGFVLLLQEFLTHYSQFSPIEDKETLLRLATTWTPFWDIKNGITLCSDCHNTLHRKLGYKNDRN